MGRFKLTIEYDGTRYSGWQMQKGGKTIQGEILDACRELFKNDEIDIFGAGRTDGGVHASGQVAHLDVATDLVPLKIKYGINDRLPPDICIINVEEANVKFHARHDANARSYIYQISRRRTAFGKKFVWWIKDNLDVNKMKYAADILKGMHDFQSFADKTDEDLSTKVLIEEIGITETGNLILIKIKASHYLWKMVRRIVGVLVEVGRNNLTEKDIRRFLGTKSDEPAKFTAPPSGLFLAKVEY